MFRVFLCAFKGESNAHNDYLPHIYFLKVLDLSCEEHFDFGEGNRLHLHHREQSWVLFFFPPTHISHNATTWKWCVHYG